MADTLIIPNSIWPNGMKVDSDGHAVFYPLGTNKIQIPTSSSEWPKGDKLVSPFVYQNDKLVGFVDTKALDIDNNDTTIDINYTHFDADLDSIMENTLTINAPVNATVNVKYGAVDKVLTEKIENLIGKGKCEVKFDKNNNKATIAVALNTTESQVADIENLLNRVLPPNIESDIEWADGVPINYTRLEYLESTDIQYINTEYVPNNETGIYMYQQKITFGDGVPMGCRNNDVDISRFYALRSMKDEFDFQQGSGCGWGPWISYPNFYGLSKTYTNYMNNRVVKAENSDPIAIASLPTIPIYPIFMFAVCKGGLVNHFWGGHIYEAAISQGESIAMRFVPCLDPEGAPCMFDIISQEPFYNDGAGDFLYPGAESQVVTSDLDENFYAKKTKHGIQRLYRIPEDYTGSKDEYAIENGFKQLVEPPMPLEGYWMPVWRETETQLICDWVETEPPAEEV